MKKIISLFLVLSFGLFLSSCGNKSELKEYKNEVTYDEFISEFEKVTENPILNAYQEKDFYYSYNQETITILDGKETTKNDKIEIKHDIDTYKLYVSNGKETVEWYVLSKKGNKVLLISKYILDASKSSEMNKWINDFNQSAFSSAEKECGNAVLLNIYDAYRYTSELSEGVKSIVQTSPTVQAKANGIKNHYNYLSGKSTGYSWWLSGSSNGRDDLIVYANSTYVPSPNGIVNSASDGDVCGLRPCVWIELE